MNEFFEIKFQIVVTEKPSSWNNLLKSAVFNEERSDFKFIVENEKIPVNKFLLSRNIELI